VISAAPETRGPARTPTRGGTGRGLGARLQAVLEAVPGAGVVADVGAGDGQVALRLQQRGVRVIATERGPGAFARLPASLDRRIGDGFQPFAPGELDGAIVAGMGSRTMVGILGRGAAVVERLSWLVLQPQQMPALLEEWILTRHWTILARTVALQANRPYAVLTVLPRI